MKFSTTFTLVATTLMLTGTNARIGSNNDQRQLVSQNLDNSISYWTEDSKLTDDTYCHGNVSGFKRSQTVNMYYCAASDDLLEKNNNNKGCGKCFKISYDGSASVYDGDGARGTPGDAIIQVIDRIGEGNKYFDCIASAFKEITGWKPDRFPMTYEQVDCPP